MKILIATVFVLSSFSSFAGFVCLKDSSGKAMLMTTGPQYISVKSLSECQKAVNASKNGFVCLIDSYGDAVLMTTGDQYTKVESIEACQRAVNVSK